MNNLNKTQEGPSFETKAECGKCKYLSVTDSIKSSSLIRTNTCTKLNKEVFQRTVDDRITPHFDCPFKTLSQIRYHKSKEKETNTVEFDRVKSIINPKLTQAIKEANEERETIQAQREKELYEKVLKERDRLLEDDYIYKLIKEAVVNNRNCIEIKSDNILITEKAVMSIPGLYLSFRIIGCFNNSCGNTDREESSSVIVYFR